MSWYTGMKDVKLMGLKTMRIDIPKSVVQEDGVFFPLYIDFSYFFDKLFDGKGRDVIGSGNFEVLSYQFWDYMWESYIWPNFWDELDDALLDSDETVSIVVGVANLHVTTENEFTNREIERDNILLLFGNPDLSSDSKSMQLSLAGFFSPAQELIMANINDIGKDSVFHECVHALKRSGDDLLKDIMYGGSDAAVTEEILTHLITDRFPSFMKLHKSFKDEFKLNFKNSNDLAIPMNISISGTLSNAFSTPKVLNVSIEEAYKSTQKVLMPKKKLSSLLRTIRNKFNRKDKGRKDGLKDELYSYMCNNGLPLNMVRSRIAALNKWSDNQIK